MNTLSFITANFVARELDYQISEGWHQGHNATNDQYRALETYSKRLFGMLSEVKNMGFTSIDLWCAHLHWAWATPTHMKMANQAISRLGLQVNSVVGNCGDTATEFRAACKTAQVLESRLLCGASPYLRREPEAAVDILREHNLRFAYINHMESDAESLMNLIGDKNHDTLGLCLDTGWLHLANYPIEQALTELAPHIRCIQLKNLHPSHPRTTKPIERGLIKMKNVLRALQAIRYNGPITIEHHPFDHAPNKECRQSLKWIRSEWIATSTESANMSA